jgi:hypothetical protein
LQRNALGLLRAAPAERCAKRAEEQGGNDRESRVEGGGPSTVGNP